MILDFGCDIKSCNAPVELVKGANYQTINGVVNVLFLRCVQQHYYMKYREDIQELQIVSLKFDDETGYYQPELPLEDDNE